MVVSVNGALGAMTLDIWFFMILDLRDFIDRSMLNVCCCLGVLRGRVLVGVIPVDVKFWMLWKWLRVDLAR